MAAMTDEALLEALDSADEERRAAAAVELAERKHPRALEASLRTLDDAPEIAHADITPAVWSLADMGLPALRALFEPMAADHPMTRLHAGRAAMEITRRRYGFERQQWPLGGYNRWAAFWRGIGYEYDAPALQREQAIERLRGACERWERGEIDE